jgi:hypothetical protein
MRIVFEVLQTVLIYVPQAFNIRFINTLAKTCMLSKDRSFSEHTEI